MNFRKKVRLGDILIDKHIIDQSQLENALAEQKKRPGTMLGEELVTLGYVSQDKINEILCEHLDIDYVDMATYEPAERVMTLLPEDMMRKYVLVPMDYDNNNAGILKVAMADPMNIFAMDDINIMTGRQVVPYLANASDIKAYLDRRFGRKQSENIANLFKDENAPVEEENEAEKIRKAEIENAPIVKLANQIIENAARDGASDIHIEPFETTVKIRYRIDGALREVETYDKSVFNALSTRYKIMSGMDISEKRKPQDGRATVMVDGREYDIRVSNLPTVYGEKIVMRLAFKEGFKREKKDLGLTEADLERFNDILKNPNGIILVTGPTGSGKSTTLASLINRINEERNAHIITLEDPIEYIHPHKKSMVNQREIGLDTLSYSNALRAALREDPDVILVGEMRDLETISTAVTAAETGHLVLSTLHTIGAAATIDRVIDVFPPHQQQQIRIQLAMVLEAVISQQLLPRSDVKGRVAAFEVMHATVPIKNLIRESKTYQITSNIQTGAKEGMITMDDALINLYQKGIINAETAVGYSQDIPYVNKRVGGFYTGV